MLVMLMGLPGSGKSYLASRLAAKFSAVYISSDEVRQEVFTEQTYSKEEKRKIYNEMLQRMTHALQQHQKVVLDATFYKEDIRRSFLRRATELNQKCWIIEVVADEGLIRQRVSQKRTNSEADFSVYQTLKKEFDPPEQEHLVLQSREDNIEEMLDRATEYLRP